jgi:peptidoglycan/xylan/chitin deacetylase (PgdA/CDA1 family)
MSKMRPIRQPSAAPGHAFNFPRGGTAASLAIALVAACAGHPSDATHPESLTNRAASLVVTGENLVANPSMETVNAARPSEPASWKPASWGVHTTAFNYASDGHTGTRSVKLTMSAYTSGDAKWAFDAVPVTAGRTYIYRDDYKSSVQTKLVAVFTKADNGVINQTLGYAPASEGWASTAYSFNAPAGAVRATVYHLIAAVGTLQVDDVRFASPQTPDLSSGVPNGNLEQTTDLNANVPLSWLSASWGTSQASFGYVTLGTPDNHAVSVNVSGYASGDAKWFFEPQPVTAGTRYLYSDSYTATSASFVTARITMRDGTYKYLNLGQTAASASQARARFAFQAPTDAVAATVMHGLATNGSLQLDDASLEVLPPVPVTANVPNASLEVSDYAGSPAPSGWAPNRWGTNDAVFGYRTDGNTGTRSVDVTIGSYTSGRAGWFFEPQAVDPAVVYRFSDAYRSNVDTIPLVVATLSNGSVFNIQLPVAFASPSWAQYVTEVFLPANTASFTVHHQLARAGYLQTDDYGFAASNNPPFTEGVVSLTFDDSWLTDYSNALPILDAHHAVATHYVITGSLGNADRMSTAMLADLKLRGHEIAGHTVNHPDLTTLSAAAVLSELQTGKQVLEGAGLGPIRHFASPYGAYNGNVLTAAAAQYETHRTTDIGYNTKTNFDLMRLKVQSIRATTSAADVAAWIARAQADRSWLIIVYHDVVTSGGSDYSATPAALDAHLTALDSAGVVPLTVDQALQVLRPQLIQP